MFSTFDYGKVDEKYQNQKSVKFEGLINSVLPLLNDMSRSSWVALSDALGLSSRCNVSKFSISYAYRLQRHGTILKDLRQWENTEKQRVLLAKGKLVLHWQQETKRQCKGCCGCWKGRHCSCCAYLGDSSSLDAGFPSNVPPLPAEAGWLILPGPSMFHLC